MNLRMILISTITATALASCASVNPYSSGADSSESGMSFFITSVNPGNGADLGGLAGADIYCTGLAAAAGSTGKTWKAYLSSTSENARDRIGAGPWVNANGVTVATSVEDLLSENNMLSKENSVSETGEVLNGRGDTPNRHDVLTGSDAEGNATDKTCTDWTTNGDGSVMVGHHDRTGGGDDPTSWSSAHGSKGCGLDALRSTGGDGLFYCFAE